MSGFRLIFPLASSSSITTAEINHNSQPMDDREQGSSGNASTCDEPLAVIRPEGSLCSFG